MYLDRSHITVNGKTYHRVLLRQSFRQDVAFLAFSVNFFRSVSW